MNHQVWSFETVMKVMIVLSVLVYATSATNYTVGGESGWSLDSDMQTWSSNNTFHVGDTLVFLFSPIHNVVEVNEFAYNACVSSSPISIDDRTSAIITKGLKVKIVLTTRYFVCGGYCTKGLKVKIVVTASTNQEAHIPSAATTIVHQFVVNSVVSSLLSIILMNITICCKRRARRGEAPSPAPLAPEEY
ncbi:hypothetical protein MKW98_017169 [Papaver atlanticum]|uniref:Phytocyanin domain-containing protein n=1 Tax=Papaver atlanticum TaxID=357466 RepID=A0AAD4SCT6_9MAGN|nr:hypothetical protein MKW98_017169 [Papaver atlanticum]